MQHALRQRIASAAFVVQLRVWWSDGIVREEKEEVVVVVRVGMRLQTDEMKRTSQGAFFRLQGYTVRQTDVSRPGWASV